VPGTSGSVVLEENREHTARRGPVRRTREIFTFKITTLSIKPVSLRPSGLAESPLLLIGLAVRLLVAEPAFKRDDDFRRCGMM
jgi:hypothetical protein